MGVVVAMKGCRVGDFSAAALGEGLRGNGWCFGDGGCGVMDVVLETKAVEYSIFVKLHLGPAAGRGVL